uniref:Uncharacterized protein n=1 Tax=Knipowitschia caucasica TaxID=637954 RepID=A0AAV2JRT2_KNICA
MEKSSGPLLPSPTQPATIPQPQLQSVPFSLCQASSGPCTAPLDSEDLRAEQWEPGPNAALLRAPDVPRLRPPRISFAYIALPLFSLRLRLTKVKIPAVVPPVLVPVVSPVDHRESR